LLKAALAPADRPAASLAAVTFCDGQC